MLERLQSAFLDAVLTGEGTPELRSQVAGPQGCSAELGLGIYRESVVSGITEALAEAYPVCHRMLGEEAFEGRVIELLRRHPPDSANLDRYGAGLPDLLAESPRSSDPPYLADLTRLEWAWYRAGRATPGAGLSLDRVAQVPEAEHGRLVFALPPGATQVGSPYPVDRVWQAHHSGEGLSQDTDAGGPCQVLVWPSPQRRRMDPIPDPDWRLLTVFAEGMPLEAVCERLADHLSPEAISARLPELIQRGWLGDFHIETGEEA